MLLNTSRLAHYRWRSHGPSAVIGHSRAAGICMTRGFVHRAVAILALHRLATDSTVLARESVWHQECLLRSRTTVDMCRNQCDRAHNSLVPDIRMASSRRGFTLIELLIVVVIIGILAAIAIPKFANSKQKAYIAAMKSDLKTLVVAEEAFYADSTRYTAYLDTTITGRGRRRSVTVSSSGLIFDPSTGVGTPVIAVGPGYWSATVTHTQIPNFTCGIGVNTDNPVDVTANDGAPICK